MQLTSPAFTEGEMIPSLYTCDDQNISPPLLISEVPSGAESLALIMDDPDVPKALKPDGVFDHWVLFNIDPATTEITEGGTAGTAGSNGRGHNAYTGPCPPAQYEPSTHRYIFVLYALDQMLPLQVGANKKEVLRALEGHILGQAKLMGRYKKK